MNRIIAIITGLALVLAGIALAPSPARAAPSGACVKSTYQISVGPYYEDDSYYVMRGGGITIPGASCDAPYEGENQQCGDFRLVRMTPSKAFGPWVYSCWTPQKLAANFSGTFRYGDGVLVEYLVYSGQYNLNTQTIHLWL